MIHCSIADQGIGIPPNEVETIFEKFRQSSHNTVAIGGTGLGLAICKEIIRAHQGQIWVQNMPQGGAQFTFTLPGMNRNRKGESI